MEYNVQQYECLMQEIKERLMFTGMICNKLYVGQWHITKMDLEICCLQIRKMLELIAMGSLVVNKTAFDSRLAAARLRTKKSPPAVKAGGLFLYIL